MIKAVNHLSQVAAQFDEVIEQAGRVKLLALQHHANLVVVPVHVLALAPVIAQRVSGGKSLFDSNFKHTLS